MNTRLSSENGASDISQKTADAIEAPLVVIDAFMNIAATMFMVACCFVTIRRALVVGAVGIVSFAADYFLHMSDVRSTGLSRLFSRSFIVDSAIALIIIGAILAVPTLVAFTITLLFFYNRHRGQKRQIREAEAESRNLENELDVLVYEAYGRPSYLYRREQLKRQLKRQSFKESRSTQMISLVTVSLLPLAIVSSLLSTTLQSKPSTASPQPTPPSKIVVNPRAPGLTTFLFPRSNSSLEDLDQKMAVFAGLTALAFSLYSVLSVPYAEWKKTRLGTSNFDKRTT